jgi:ParB family chromosome partitioning protein
MSAQRNALGRGLGALISGKPPNTQVDPAAPPLETPVVTPETPRVAPLPDTADAHEGVGTTPRVRVDLIDPNPDQPRRTFDPERLSELSASIARSGVLQPVVVTRNGSRYTLLVGERRWRASRAAGLQSIPAVIADVDPEERLELAIVENVQRHDLNPIELAHAYRALAERGATQDDIGRRVGKDRSSVANLLRLLDLPVDMQADVESGRLSMGHAKALLQVSDADQRRELRDRVLREGLSVRQAEHSGREIAGPSGRLAGSRAAAATPSSSPSSSDSAAPTEDPDLLRLEATLRAHFQSRVKIHGTREKGRLEIDYSSGEDLERATRLILEGV